MAGSNSGTTPLKDVAAAFAAYIAVPAALFYPVGFLSRWLQIYQPYDIKIQTAWHATAISDRLDVVGQGVLVLIPPLALSIVLSVLLSNVIYYLWLGRQRWLRVGRRLMIVALIVLCFGLWGSMWLIVLFKYYSCALLIGAVPESSSQREICLTSDLNITFVPILSYFFGSLLGGYVIYRDALQRGGIHGLGFIRGLRGGWALRGLAIAYVVSIASVLLLSPNQEEPSLPRVEYGPEDHRAVALLLSHHADGRWYLLRSDVPGNPETFEAEGDWATRVLAMPDGEAGKVQFLRANPEAVYRHKEQSTGTQGTPPTFYPGDVIRVDLHLRDDESGVLGAEVRCHQEETGPMLVMSRTGEVEKGGVTWVRENLLVDNSLEVREQVTWNDEDIVEETHWVHKGDEVEKGEVNWDFEKAVTNETPTGLYRCEYLKVADADSDTDNAYFLPLQYSFRVAERDEQEPVLQEARITVTRP